MRFKDKELWAEEKSRKIIQKIIIGGAIVLGIVVFRYFDLGQYFT